MKIAEKRAALLNQIASLQNDTIISELYEMLKIESEIKEPYILTDLQLAAVSEAEEQIRNGQYMTQKLARKDFEAWKGK